MKKTLASQVDSICCSYDGLGSEIPSKEYRVFFVRAFQFRYNRRKMYPIFKIAAEKGGFEERIWINNQTKYTPALWLRPMREIYCFLEVFTVSLGNWSPSPCGHVARLVTIIWDTSTKRLYIWCQCIEDYALQKSSRCFYNWP